jgi:hypothetical protein
LVQTMTPKGHFEINWPLGTLKVAKSRKEPFDGASF